MTGSRTSIRGWAVAAAVIVGLASCGGSGALDVATDVEDSIPTVETTTVVNTTTVPIPDDQRPTGRGGLSSLFGSSSSAEDSAVAVEAEPPIDCAPDEDCDRSDNSDGSESIELDQPRPTTTFVPHDIAMEYRPFCATLADIERRAEFEDAPMDDFEIVRDWLTELAAVSPVEISLELDRLVQGVGEMMALMEGADGAYDPDAFEPSEFEAMWTFEQDAARVGEFVEWACFGRGDFDPDQPPATAAPNVTVDLDDVDERDFGDPFCSEIDALSERMEQIDAVDEAAIVPTLQAWLDGPAREAPPGVREDFAIFEAWLDSVAGDFTTEELLGNDDLMPPEVSEANDRIDEWTDEYCWR